MSTKWDDKIIRDPINGYVGLTKEEIQLIDTPPFQRLRRIKQLALTDLVYPGATHTRFEHSLGCLFVADRIAQKLNFPEDDRKIIRYAALLHDLGHGPFSHVFENILELANGKEVNHSEITIEIIKHTKITKILGEFSKPVVAILESKAEETHLKELISGSLDVDKLDYLIRDSNYTGVAYGIFDLERIIHTMRLVKDIKGNQQLVIRDKGKDSLESFRMGRFLMHVQVYQHHVRLISDGMLTRAAKIAFKENIIDPQKFIFNTNSESFIKNYLKFDDFSFLEELQIKNSNAAKLAIMLINRFLLKRGYQKRTEEMEWLILRKLKNMTKSDFEKMESDLAKKVGADPDFIIVYPQSIQNPLYRDPDRYLRKEKPIMIEMKDGAIKPFDEISPLTGAPAKYVENFFVFCPESLKTKISTAIENYLIDLK